MPRKGYRSITLPESDYLKLLEKARLYGTTPQGIIKIIINDGAFFPFRPVEPVTRVQIPVGAPLNLFCQRQKSFTKKDAFLNERKDLYRTGPSLCTVQLDKFMKFCLVDLHLAKSTACRYALSIKQLFNAVGPDPTTDQIRDFLASAENPNTYNNHVKALRAYFRDFMGKPERVMTFRIVRAYQSPPWCPSKQQLQEFYSALEGDRERALFLLYATSGRRRSEILNLRVEDLDLENRIIKPTHQSATKRTWYSFFNEECQEALRKYMKERRDPYRSGKLVPIGGGTVYTMFKMAYHKSGLHITPQTLRLWFANEMARLGVPDRFIDAFQGRIPRSVLARHYTDYSLENLKAIYDKAGLKVLS